MGEPQLVMLAEQLAVALLAPFAWLVICKTIRGLRRRVGFSYSIASLMVLITCLAQPKGLTPPGAIAAVIVLAVLYGMYRRALRKQSFEASTIISYENHDIF
jgi:hypothetical protein